MGCVAIFLNVASVKKIKMEKIEKKGAQKKVFFIKRYSLHPIFVLIGPIDNIQKVIPANRSGGVLKKGGGKFI